MGKARALDRRRQSVRNIRKITRTMELIANARFKRAMDRAVASSQYSEQIGQLVSDLALTEQGASHPLLRPRLEKRRAVLLVLTANRGMCGGYNAGVLRLAVPHVEHVRRDYPAVDVDVSGQRGIAAFRFRQIPIAVSYTQFEDNVTYDQVVLLANRYLDRYTSGDIDRLEVCYTKFVTSARQVATVERLLPLGAPEGGQPESDTAAGEKTVECLPSAEDVLETAVPASFRARLFSCFLDAAVSEQIARMVAMKSATENADDIIRQLSRKYNRARQTQITGEIMEVISGAQTLEG
jgi:F-type H+-transporting ATPase subunit gamma